MKAIVFDEELKLVNDYKKPVPQKGEALVRVTLAGICNTDYEITKGYMGYKGVLGHEAVGVVEEINDVLIVQKSFIVIVLTDILWVFGEKMEFLQSILLCLWKLFLKCLKMLPMNKLYLLNHLQLLAKLLNNYT